MSSFSAIGSDKTRGSAETRVQLGQNRQGSSNLFRHEEELSQ